MKNNIKIILIVVLIATIAFSASSYVILNTFNRYNSTQPMIIEVVKSIEVFEKEEFDVYAFCEDMYSIQPELLEAIERQETAHYTSEIYLNKNNTHGCKVDNRWCGFDSTNQSTIELARTLAFKYKVVNEYYDLSVIGKEFAPNDPLWPEKVAKIIEEIRSGLYES